MECRLTDDWENTENIIIYGFGKVAHDNLDFFKNNFNIVYIVDSDKRKCNIEYKGIAVKYVDDVKDELKNYKIIIMTANRNVELVGKDLEKLGFISGENFCSMEQFLTEWFWKYKKKACLMEVHSTITSRCTLKCRHCNMFMPYYKEQIDYTAIDILADLELLFRHVDYIVSYRLLGGEPLLNKELADMIELIGQKYGDRIGNIGIITNGTLLPSEKLIEVSKKYDIKYDFSDYTDVVDYKERFENAVQIVSDANLRYSVNRSLRWCDFGFPVNNRMYDFDKVREHMLSCGPIFHGLNDGKYYYCHVSWSADKAKLLKTVPDDYVDLRVLNDDENAKEIHMEQKSKYEIEIENFRKIFDDKKNMRIAIYGIGRRTATLLPGITDYNITGLLDRDKNNVGKELCDIKVIPIDNIEEKADLIIINSDPSNYEIIFRRISGEVTIPVYYADGRLACLSDKDKSYEQNEYWKSSYEELKDKIDQADIVSFDIFDTLIMRKIFLLFMIYNKIDELYSDSNYEVRAWKKS